MPPVRNITAAKPVKTERTHEENQERAYIAASRRSDRSLEARIESARRASEIHKKRTGRALRVTEQDVINEEMYEEEDDDLPAQYRRLTAHLHTNSIEFNRRLQAYMATQMATRGALSELGASGPLASQYPNAPHFAHYGVPHSVPTSMLTPQIIHQQPRQFQHSPYHVPTPGVTSQPRHRSASEFQTVNQTDSNVSESRRASMPVQPLRSPLQTPTTQVPSPHIQSPSGTLSPAAGQTPGPLHQKYSDTPYTFPTDNSNTTLFNSQSPLTTVLPNDTQQLLYGSQFDFSGSYGYLTGGNQFSGSFDGYSYNPNPALKIQYAQSVNDGPAATLSPLHPLDIGFDSTNNISNPSSAAADDVSAAYSPTFVPSYDAGGLLGANATVKDSSDLGSGTVTPSGGDSFFNSFISGYEDGNPAPL